jgi:hypothetical protein
VWNRKMKTDICTANKSCGKDGGAHVLLIAPEDSVLVSAVIHFLTHLRGQPSGRVRKLAPP